MAPIGDELDMCHANCYINSFIPYLCLVYSQLDFGDASKNIYNVPIFIPNSDELHTIMNRLNITKKSVNQYFMCYENRWMIK
jgi:hypothetical protein